MAPARSTRGATGTSFVPVIKKTISTRSRNVQDQNINPIPNKNKRKAENSPLKTNKVKRSALGNLTNNVINLNLDDEKKNAIRKVDTPTSKINFKVLKPKLNDSNNIQEIHHNKILTRAAVKNAVAPAPTHSTVVKTKDSSEVTVVVKSTTRRISNEFEKTEDSLYVSALEDVPSSDSVRLSGNYETIKRQSLASRRKSENNTNLPNNEINIFARLQTPSPLKRLVQIVPPGVADFDKENWDDPLQVSNYAMDIFNYLKSREPDFLVEDYMPRQIYLSKWMRSLLVDWMVEVQETFELNHETLYLAVKLVDIYLGKVIVMKDKLQLLGAAALFLSCKYDERVPPLVEDFLYICDGAYKHNELIKMEMHLFKTIGFDLGIPLSYRFLRRYARCSKVPMPTLTLARYILELSLMDYSTISFSDSQLACAALFIALRMTGLKKVWTPTLEYYTGYKLEEFAYLVPVLNSGLHRKPKKDSLKTIHNKYSHKIFYEVATKALLTTNELLESTFTLDISRKQY